MKRSAAEEMRLLVELSRAIGVRSIYPAGHPSAERAVEQALAAHAACLRAHRSDAVTFLMIEGEVFLDERPLRSDTVHLTPFVRTMERAGVQRLTLGRGLEAPELRELVGALGRGGGFPEGGCVDVGRVKVAEVDGVSLDELTGRAGERLSEEVADRVEAALERLLAAGSAAGEEAVSHLDGAVWQLVEGLASTRRSRLLLAPRRTDGADRAERAFRVHSVQVALLAVALGRSLGLEGVALQELGMAAVLHDVGKLSLPAALREREGRLEGREWEQMMLHPELGAARLAATPGVSRLAMLVAYEHHLRWDGEPSYPPTSRRPGLASQVTAVADSWDAVVSGRFPPGAPGRAAAVDAWRRRAGSRLDPFLAGVFLELTGEGREEL